MSTDGGSKPRKYMDRSISWTNFEGISGGSGSPERTKVRGNFMRFDPTALGLSAPVTVFPKDSQSMGPPPEDCQARRRCMIFSRISSGALPMGRIAMSTVGSRSIDFPKACMLACPGAMRMRPSLGSKPMASANAFAASGEAPANSKSSETLRLVMCTAIGGAKTHHWPAGKVTRPGASERKRPARSLRKVLCCASVPPLTKMTLPRGMLRTFPGNCWMSTAGPKPWLSFLVGILIATSFSSTQPSFARGSVMWSTSWSFAAKSNKLRHSVKDRNCDTLRIETAPRCIFTKLSLTFVKYRVKRSKSWISSTQSPASKFVAKPARAWSNLKEAHNKITV
mmetsp:Transcript_30977/g.90294  ORF Transcript_30977/g.90294 Transcript_30977/m.90294 type:complete len:338 (+) Transcript_30977:357-1370(+)